MARSQQMKWMSVNDAVPKHRQEVLLNCNGTYCLAKFNATLNQFEMRGGKVFEVGKFELHWAELVDPGL
jgi:hypothetical protein